MKKSKPKARSESGITLIALLVMIIIIVILAGITIRALTGNESLLNFAETASKDYHMAAEKEQIELEIRNSIMNQGQKGEEPTLGSIAEELRQNTDLIADVTVEGDENDTEGYITVTAKDGHIYQIYYNGTYGTVKVEYIGGPGSNGPGNAGGNTQEEIKKTYPNIIASYEEPNITATVTIIEGKIKNMQLMYKGKVVAEEKDGKGITYKIDADKTGWYTVKAESDKGKVKYAYVRAAIISDKIQIPTVTISERTKKGDNGWYIEVPKVTITKEGKGQIYYTLSGGKTQEEAEYTKEIEIDKSGITRITAWVQGEDGKESRKVTQIIKVDIDAPEIKDITLTGDKGEKVEGIEYTWIISAGEIGIIPQIDEETKKEDKRKWNKWI